MDKGKIREAKLKCKKNFKQIAEEIGAKVGEVVDMTTGAKKPSDSFLFAIGLEPKKKKEKKVESEPEREEAAPEETGRVDERVDSADDN